MTFSLILAKAGLFDPIAKPLAAVLAFFYSLIPNYGIAIVLLTIAMMIVLTPLTIKQTRSMLVMQKLQPEMKKLQEQHKNDRQALNEAVMALYKEHNASPLGGCLPMLLPFPLFIALLEVLRGLSRIEHPKGAPAAGIAVPKFLTTHTQMFRDIVAAHGHLDAFGIDLAKSARSATGGLGRTLPYFILMLVMVGTQFYQQYQLTSRNPAANSQPGQAAMMKFIPLFFGVISLGFPAGVVLYWTVSNIIRIGQQWALYRYDPKVKALVVKDVKEIEAKTREIDAKGAAAKAKDQPAKPGGFRGLLANAAEAAADRRNQSGKGAPRPTGRPGDKAAGATKPGAKAQPAKGTGSTPNAGKRPGSGSPAAGKAPAKGGAPGKATPAGRPGGARPPLKPGGVAKAGAPGAGGAGGAKPAAGGAKPGAGGAKPGAGGAKPGAGGAKPGVGSKPAASGNKPADDGPKAPAKLAAPAATPAASAEPAAAGQAPAPAKPAAPATPVAPAQAANGTNGAPQPAVTPGNGAVNPATNGAPANPEGSDAVAPAAPAGQAGNGNGAPKGGRTGGGSARTVSSRRRRRGR